MPEHEDHEAGRGFNGHGRTKPAQAASGGGKFVRRTFHFRIESGVCLDNALYGGTGKTAEVTRKRKGFSLRARKGSD